MTLGCGEPQVAVSTSTGETTRADTRASARARRLTASRTTAASKATTTTPTFGKGPVRAAKAITKAESSTTLLAHALCEAGGGHRAVRTFAVSVRDHFQTGGRHAQGDRHRSQ